MTETESTFDPVGEAEIADRLGVKTRTVNVWRQRGLLPEPEGQVSRRPVWRWKTIHEWATITGRLHLPGESSPR